eukprot:3715493-Alexandrium_andersonii.AAC.1
MAPAEHARCSAPGCSAVPAHPRCRRPLGLQRSGSATWTTALGQQRIKPLSAVVSVSKSL